MEPPYEGPEWVFVSRSDPKPIPIAYLHGVVEPGAVLPVQDADMVAVCGFLGCDLKPFNPLVAALPRIMQIASSLLVQSELYFDLFAILNIESLTAPDAFHPSRSRRVN